MNIVLVLLFILSMVTFSADGMQLPLDSAPEQRSSIRRSLSPKNLLNLIHSPRSPKEQPSTSPPSSTPKKVLFLEEDQQITQDPSGDSCKEADANTRKELEEFLGAKRDKLLKLMKKNEITALIHEGSYKGNPYIIRLIPQREKILCLVECKKLSDL